MSQSSSPVYVSRISTVTALGPSLQDTWLKLMEGSTAIAPVSRFSTGQLYCHEAACINEQTLPDGENTVYRLTASTLDQLGSVPPDTTVIWTGIKGTAEGIEAGESPVRPDQYRSWICRRMHLKDDGFEINAACVAFTAGVAFASQLISTGARQNVLVCGADVVSRFTFTGFAALRAIAPNGCRPFDSHRSGLALGDGAAAMLLCSGSSADRNKLPVLARASGWGSSNDGNHITGPSRDGAGLALAIEKALEKAALLAEQVECVCGHGTGTYYSDAMELAGLRAVFGERTFPLFSVKGAIGHAMGAAGGIESAIALLSMQKKTAPPTIGLLTPEPAASRRVAALPQSFAGNNIVKVNSGFGGCNCAVVFENV